MSSTQPLTPRSADGTPITASPNWVLGQSSFLRTDDGSAAINVNGLPSGAAAVLWNGTGAGDAGGDWSHEAQGSESAAAMHSGTNGLDSGVRSVGQETRFDNGSNIDVAGSYDSLSFWINPQAFPAGSRLDIRWRTSAGGTPGAKLNVADYVTDFDTGVWQKVTIPIADFGLTADVAKLVFIFAAQGGQHFFFDDITLDVAAGGGPFVWRVKAPDANTRYHVSMMVLVLSGPASGWTPSAFANITSGLANGLVIRQRKISTGEVAWSLNCKDNVDLFGRFHPQDDITFSDGTLLVGFMIKPGRASVKITDDDVLEFVVSDDLSLLASARAFAHYAVETVVS